MDPARPFKPDRNYFSQATFNLDFQSPQMTTDYRLLNFDPDIKSDLATDKSSYVISHHGHWTPQDMEEPIPLAPDLSRGIYPLILLLTSITEGKLMDFRTTRGDDTLPDDGGTDEELFSAFVNKISLFLCTKPGPDTISSCIVLRNDSGQVHYAVASNQRSEAELKSVGAQMVTILEFFSLEAVSKEDALSLVLSVVCRRAVSYAKKLYKSLKGKEGSAGCIRICAQYSPATAIYRMLVRLSELADPRVIGGQQKEQQLTALVNCADEFDYQALQALLSSVREESQKLGGSGCWSDLRHAVGRLRSYKTGIDIALRARQKWPELFNNFKVILVPSGKPAPNPLGNWALPPRGDDEKLMFTAPARAQEIEKLSAAWIARRIQSDPVVIEELVVKVLNFNITYSLDDRILEMRRKKASSKVTLHSEVRLHNWFEISERNGVLGGLQFFRRYKYMGTSKPPCKLCSYFFEEYQRAAMPRERWQIRPSHMNLYYNWRYPDIFPSQGEWARKIRTKVMKEMKARLGDDIIRTFFDLTADGRPVDSSTNSVPKGVIKLLGTGGLGIQTPSVTASPTTSNTQDLQQAMGKMSLHTTAHAQPSRNLITQTQIEEPRNSHAGERSRPHKSENKEGENGEDRIVLVFRGRREKS